MFTGARHPAKVLHEGAVDRAFLNGEFEPGAGLRLERDPPDERQPVQQSGGPHR